MSESMNLRCGEWVTVRSEEEILATLDEKGEIDGLPFMSEMLEFCGRRLRVGRRADKTCDTISGDIVGRRMQNAVHLEGARCDGASHGGCQAGCLLFWKEDWLEREGKPSFHPLWAIVAASPGPGGSREGTPGRCSRDILESRAIRSDTGQQPQRYRCQTTALLDATSPLSPWSLSQYLRDWLSGNVRLSYMARIAILRVVRTLCLLGRGFSLKVKVYDALAKSFGEPAWPFYRGRLSGRTPVERLDLEPGEMVVVKSHEEILETLNDRSNRGLSFTPEMVRYCGGRYRVRDRVARILDERSGEMVEMAGDCIILEDVVCRSECSTNRIFCPRSIYPFWREIWLRRTDSSDEVRSGESA